MKRVLIALSIVPVVGLFAAAGGTLWGYVHFSGASRLAQDTDVVIARGTSVAGIARQFHRLGIVRHPLVFEVGVRIAGLDQHLKAGEYRLPERVSPRAAARILASGDTVKRYLTIPEGLSSAQILARLRMAEGLEGMPVDAPAEGSLLPETYRFSHGDSARDILRRMRRAQQAVLDELWAGRADGLPLKTQRDALILASIVEKETGIDGERGRVAGVFLNRLRRGMRLQSDPTVVYAVGGGRTLGRALSKADLRRDHPYNTYRIDGLPPGPISHPGRAAIAAVLNPAPTDALYFVADGTGGHAFARTLEEHNRNVAEWRRLQHVGRPAPD